MVFPISVSKWSYMKEVSSYCVKSNLIATYKNIVYW